MKSQFPKRKEMVILLLPFILIGAFLCYVRYIEKTKNLLQGQWVITERSGYITPGEVCSISFLKGGISQTECKGGKGYNWSSDSVTQSEYQVKLGRIHFFDGKIISSSPSIGWPYGVPDETAYFKIESEHLISVKYPSIPLNSPQENTTSGESTCKWRKIK